MIAFLTDVMQIFTFLFPHCCNYFQGMVCTSYIRVNATINTSCPHTDLTLCSVPHALKMLIFN